MEILFGIIISVLFVLDISKNYQSPAVTNIRFWLVYKAMVNI